MIAQVTGAVARAFLVVMLIATPSLLLPAVSSDATQIVALAAICAGAMTFFEYSATYPGLVEFRDAPPFNRIRFGAMFIAVFLVSAMCAGETEPNAMTQFIRAIATLFGDLLNFPYSPVRLMTLMLPLDADPARLELLQAAAGLSYLISILSLALFAALIRVRRWPLGNGSFNFWVNLPTFDPTAGGDVVERMMRVARINIAIGFLLPFLFPAVVKATTVFFDQISLGTPQTLIWTVTAWSLLPSGLVMRGFALRRIARLICEQRRRAAPVDETSGLQPA